MALTAHERASAHYRAAKKYMSYGDTPKSKAHMKRALYYGFGNDDMLMLYKDIDGADITGDSVVEVLTMLLSKTLKCVRHTAVTPDDDDQGKNKAIEDIFKKPATEYMDYPPDVISDYKKGIPVFRVAQNVAYIKDPRRLYGINQQTRKLINESIGPNLVDPEHVISKATFAFFNSSYETEGLHEDVSRLAKGTEIVEAALRSCYDKSVETSQKGDKGELNQEDREVARLLVCFWESALNVFKETPSHVTVEPLAHATPSFSGFSLFQLLVKFSDEGTRSLVDKTVKLHESANPDKEARSKAWKSMLKLMLEAATKVRGMGPFYALEWNTRNARNAKRPLSVDDGDVDQKHTKPGFGMKHR
jgi:hypothetical protein